MPRPPILSPVDFKALFEKGATYAEWLKGKEEAENAGKMEELRQKIDVSPAFAAHLKALPRAVHVLSIAEGWCGDVHRHVPVLMKLAEQTDKVKVSFVARETDKDVFARYLTNGGEAIPKFVFFNDEFTECGNWGPMPTDCRRLIARGKAAGDVGKARERVSKVYESDPHCEVVQKELLELMDIATCQTP